MTPMQLTLPRRLRDDAPLVVDLFAGGGGASVGIEAALGRRVDLAINHSPIALAVHRLNHPNTVHLPADIWEVHPEAATGGRAVDVLWASPDCTHFSVAKGDVPRDQGIRSLAWAVVGDPRADRSAGANRADPANHPGWMRTVRPRVVFMENVREFESWGPLCPEGRPVKRLAGTEFARFIDAIQDLGYEVEWRVLDAAAFGAPTRRRRLFIVARRDGLPIRWPEPTHGEGPGLLPERTAAEIIDWSIPAPSIFERRRPLAPKTLERIAAGIDRYVLREPQPFIVDMTRTNRPLHRDEPLGVVTTQGNRFNLVAPTLIQTGHGDRPGQAPRVPGLHKPLGTVCAGGAKRALVAAMLTKHYGGMVGHKPDRSVGAITARDGHALTTATLALFRGTSAGHSGAGDVRAPLPTVTAGGCHVGLVRAFLTAYYSSGSVGQSLRRPVRTITAKARLGLVTVHGVDYQIADIGMRMLEPHELLAAQFGRFAAGYRMDATKVVRGKHRQLSKADRIRLIGNSVAPEVSEALVRANTVALQREACVA